MAELLGATTLLGMRNRGLGSLKCFGWCVEQLLESGNNTKNNNSDIVARGLLPSLLGPIVIFLSLAF